MTLSEISAYLSADMRRLTFPSPITHVYNPLEYAWEVHNAYLKRYGGGPAREVVLVGMNPGPWGMAQTGVPFGDPVMVRDWLQLSGHVETPDRPHPKRPVYGLGCPRREVSGTRLWGWARDRFHTPDRFFERFFVHNYCPLSFMEESGRNFTPDKLPQASRSALFGPCDCALQRLAEYFQPKHILGVGQFAEQRIRAALPAYRGGIGVIPHPSPANPAANRGWAEAAEAALNSYGLYY